MPEMSEVTPCSDKTGSDDARNVRSHPMFRQNRERLCRKCPKSPHVQTKQRVIMPEMSEVTPCSDKTESDYARNVRSHPMFRQNRERLCRKCPKSPHVQTKQGVIMPEMSEVTPCSDKTESDYAGNVRSHPMFRQNRE